MFIQQKKIQTDCKLLNTVVFALIVIGLLFIYSSSSVFALEKYGNSQFFVKKQLIGVLIGLIGMFIFRYTPLEYIKQASPLLFLGSLALTALTLISSMATRIHGSSRWLYFGGMNMQPGELLKTSLIIYLAYFLAKKEHVPHSFIRMYLPLLFIIGLPSALLLKQPDFGMTVTLITTALSLFFVMHVQIKHILISLAACIPAAAALIYMQPYRWKRILTFLNPWQDPQGAGFQIIQSLIAIGSGSLWGTGVAHSKQKFFYLPMQHTDFIFSIIAEETGFIGVMLLLSLYSTFLYVGMRIATQQEDTFRSLVTLGFVVMTSLQTVMNLAVTTGLVPTKGIGLPFVSYGNSALICGLCMLGLVNNCVYAQRRY